MYKYIENGGPIMTINFVNIFNFYPSIFPILSLLVSDLLPICKYDWWFNISVKMPFALFVLNKQLQAMTRLHTQM